MPRASGSPACCHTSDCGPSITSAVDLFAAVRGQAVQEHRVVARGRPSARRRPVQPANARAGALRLVLLPHRRPHVGVDRVGALHRVVRVGRELDRRRRGCGRGRRRRRRARSPAATRRRARRRRARRANASDAATLLPSPTYTTRRPSRSPKSSRSVSRSASAWHGCARSDSRFTTGTSTARGHALEQRRGRRRAPRSACTYPASVRATSSARLAPVDADLLARGCGSGGRRASTTAISIEIRVRADGFSNSAATP